MGTDKDEIRSKVLAEIGNDIEFLQDILVDATIIAEDLGYDCTAWDALYVLFADRFSWTPEKVRSLTIQELGWMLDTFFHA